LLHPEKQHMNDYNFKKSKNLGQNFLVDVNAINLIVDELGITDSSSIVEVGPGQGALTSVIYNKNPKKFFLIEKDNRLIEELKNKFPSATVLNEDAVTIKYPEQIFCQECSAVGNLPYYVSTAILENLINHFFKKMVLMFQKEVADRILASPKDSDYGRLSLLASENYKAQRLIDLEPGSFTPRPKIDSTVIVFNRLDAPRVKIKDRIIYDRLINRLFSERRKKIRSGLKSLKPDINFEDFYFKTNIDVNLRPQELSIEQFALISEYLL